MNIKKLTLKNFRNYSEEYFEFSDGINVLTGKNAQGKTNCAEAVFFLCTGYSPRANKDKLVIKNGEEKAEVFGEAQSVYGNVSVKIVFNKSDKKTIYVNGLPVLRIGELFGNIHSVYFNPQELKLVQESPEDRRRFMNVSLSQMNKSYFYALTKYNKILSQRNNLLKNKDKSIIKETLFLWDKQLTDCAGKIIRERNLFLEKIQPIAQEKHATLSSNKEVLEMKTESGYYGTEEEIAYSMLSDLKTALIKDMELGYTTIGPHRDDIKFMLNGLDARYFGSQGQQRTIALSLKLAEAEIFKLRFNEYPILILDDVLSELDKERQKKLIKEIDGIQTIFTTAEFSKTLFRKTDYNKIEIKEGKVIR